MGVDAVATSGPMNNGVVGMTTNGAFGVDGIGGANAGGGVAGSAQTGIGVYGVSTSGEAVAGTSDSGNGVAGVSNGTTPDVAGGNFSGDYIGLLASTGTATGTTYPLDVRSVADRDLFYVDSAGNTHVYGTLYLHSGQQTYAHTRSAGVHATTYTATMSSPTLEHIGEGQLTEGQAFVRLNPSFAQAIDSSKPYEVFITPEGDTRGVYVTQKTMTGFVVRENQSGRSTTAFSYRIVASQYGEAGRDIALQPDSTIEAPMHDRRASRSEPPLKAKRLLSSVHGPVRSTHFVPRRIDDVRLR
jgi:hypothetical protein